MTSETAVVNNHTVFHRAAFSRQKADGQEISRLTVTYVVTRQPDGFRISAMVLHAA